MLASGTSALPLSTKKATHGTAERFHHCCHPPQLNGRLLFEFKPPNHPRPSSRVAHISNLAQVMTLIYFIIQINVLLQDSFARSLPVDRLNFVQMNIALVELEKFRRDETGMGLSGTDSLWYLFVCRDVSLLLAADQLKNAADDSQASALVSIENQSPPVTVPRLWLEIGLISSCSRPSKISITDMRSLVKAAYQDARRLQTMYCFPLSLVHSGKQILPLDEGSLYKKGCSDRNPKTRLCSISPIVAQDLTPDDSGELVPLFDIHYKTFMVFYKQCQSSVRLQQDKPRHAGGFTDKSLCLLLA